MTTKNKVIFNLNVNLPNKIKLFALHPKKQWIAIITTTNSFSIWNYREKILIKNFNCSTLDDSKNFQIREIMFYDKYSLPFSTNQPMRSNIIFVSPYKIYLYDYLTDAIKQINEKQIQQKNIRKVCAYSESKICVSLNDGSFKILDNRDLYTKNTMTIKNIRGYHTKPITWLIAYCQNENEMPRVITASAQDGLMACWNIDTLLHSAQVPDPASPSFKFLMQKGGKHDSNNGQQILSLQYDSSSYRLVTLTQSYITIWSTMTGIQLKRLKNLKFKQILFCNHFSFGPNCFLVHNGKPQLILLRQSINDYEIQQCVDLKNYLRQADNNIVNIKNLPQNPEQIFICTQANLFVIEINKFYRPSYGFHNEFITKLTTINSKQFVIKAEGSIRSDIDSKMLQKIKFEEEILFNSFFLSCENGAIYFNLMQFQIENMLYQQRKYKLHKIYQDSLFCKSTNSQSLIEINSDATQLLIFNVDLSYYEIYCLYQAEKQESLIMLNDSKSKSIDFYSKLIMISNGYAKDIVWHQYKNQVGMIKGFDKNGHMVHYINQKKGGIFSTKQKSIRLNQSIVAWRACIFQRSKNQNKYQMIFKSQPIQTKLYRIYNFGLFFGYSCDQNGTQIVKFINDQNTSSKQIVGLSIWPQRIFVSYCQSYHIYVYDGYFIIYRQDQNGQLSYYRSVQQTIIQGMFWQKYFFFITKNSLFFMQITNLDIILIKIADSMFTIKEKRFQLLIDDLQEIQQKLPQGKLQLLAIVNSNLLMLNHFGQINLINLKLIPYIEFCIEVVLGNIERLGVLYKKSNSNIQSSMKQTLQRYGINIPLNI